MSIFRELGIREGEDRINEEVVYLIARTYTYLENAITRFLAKYNLSPAKFNILLIVKHVGGDNGLAQNTISKRLLVTTSNMTRVIDKLQEEHYVKRIAQRGDRRVNLISITEKGVKILDDIWPQYKKMIDAIVGGYVSNTEKKQMAGLLDKLRGDKK